jgi:hypothetical protein
MRNSNFWKDFEFDATLFQYVLYMNSSSLHKGVFGRVAPWSFLPDNFTMLS